MYDDGYWWHLDAQSYAPIPSVNVTVNGAFAAWETQPPPIKDCVQFAPSTRRAGSRACSARGRRAAAT